MKKIGLFAGIIGVVIGSFLLLSKPAGSPQVNNEPAAKLSFATVSNEVAKKSATLLDVRSSEEYASGHFAGAVNLDVENIRAGKLPDSAKTQPLYIYCRSGNRSAQATELLKAAGYTAVTDLGGLDDVEAMGGTLITAP